MMYRSFYLLRQQFMTEMHGITTLRHAITIGDFSFIIVTVITNV